MQKERLPAECFLEVALKHSPHLCVLCKDQRPVANAQHLLCDLSEAGQFSGTSGYLGPVL